MSLVLDAGSLKKIKINLEDYAYSQDLSHKILLSELSPQDSKILEEILFSSIKTTAQKLMEATSLSLEALNHALSLFKNCGLIKEEGDHLVIDKELRKYFDIEIQRFEDDFEPNIDFLVHLLKKIPIHVLPSWYALPRTSTHIFESIVEKHLQSPQIYQRLISEIQGQEPLLKPIIDVLFTSDELELSLEFLEAHFNFSKETLFQVTTLLEYNLVASVRYKKIDNAFKGFLTPFAEFKNYLNHLRKTEARTLDEKEVQKITLSPFAFIEGMFTLIKCFKSKTYSYPLDRSSESELKEALAESELSYLDFEELMQKLLQTQLIDSKNNQINLNETSFNFISMKPESAALVLYRHPLNKPRLQLSIPVEKGIRECEKAACRLLGKGWVLFEEFIEGIVVPLNEDGQVLLKKAGRQFSYVLPTYGHYEQEFLHHIFMDWFEKVGVIETGFYASKPCIRLTTLGIEIFS